MCSLKRFLMVVLVMISTGCLDRSTPAPVEQQIVPFKATHSNADYSQEAEVRSVVTETRPIVLSETMQASDGPVDSKAPVFFLVDRASDSGIEFQYRNGEEAGHCGMPEPLGGGVAILDYDADGALDVCIAGGGEYAAGPSLRGLSPGLFRQQSPWRYAETTQNAGAAIAPCYSHGVAAADYQSATWTETETRTWWSRTSMKHRRCSTIRRSAIITGWRSD